MTPIAERHIPGGVNSNVRLDGPSVFFARGKGPWLWDIDGNDYVDYLLGQGPAFLGHAPADVVDAVEAACRGGMVYAAQHPLEVEAAELMCRAIGWADMVRFGSSGTEVVQAAIRLARAATGRREFVRFEGHYHGWLDNVLIEVGDDGPEPASEGQIADYLNDCHMLPWNDLDAVADLLKGHSPNLAAVIMEPMMVNAGAIEPLPGYLEGVRRLCDQYGVILIFDEIITGFRVALGGAAARYGVVPDLATYGKAMAGSWPVAALAGSAELMGRFGTGDVNHSGTFNANIMGMAATVATLRYLEDSTVYEELDRVGGALMRGLRDLADAASVPLHIQGLPMAFHVSFGEGDVVDFRGLQAKDAARYRAFVGALFDCGVWVARRGIWYVSTAHGDREVNITLDRVEAALARMKAQNPRS
jgi:glutamate-1-semialdehyde 2,1-aminomutase